MKNRMIDQDIYDHAERHDNSLSSAEIIVSLILKYNTVNSAIDVGCGVGTFLHELKKNGVKRIQGLDSSEFVDISKLVIEKKNFNDCNLERPPQFEDKFDIAICLEVAEHLKPEYSEEFINYLTELSDIVCFSAAIPGQGGVEHINEKWPDYWAEIFHRKSFYAIDCIRPNIWNDNNVLDWYKQNIILFVQERTLEKNPNLLNEYLKQKDKPLSIVHPVWFSKKNKEIENLRNQLKKFKKPNLRDSLKFCLKSIVYRRF